MRDLRSLVVVVLVLAATVGVLGADTWAPDPEVPGEPALALATSGAVAGSQVCGIGETGDEQELTITAARPPGVGSGPAEVETQRLHEGSASTEELPAIFPGAAAGTTFADDDELTATSVAWRGAPAASWREWHVEGSEDVPDTLVTGGCAAPASPWWIVPGMSTEGGDEARLRLTNPFRSAATVRVSFLTPEGITEPLILQNLSVPPRSVREIVVNETLPEEPDLAAVVETATGRMSVEGLQISRSAIGGIDGASLLQAAAAPGEAWTVPWVSDGAASASWLWIANAGQRTAAVELTLHTPGGGELPVGLSEVSVPPGEQRRVDLSGTFPEGVRTAALTARSNGAPVAVSGATNITSDDPRGSGIAVQLGAAADPLWVLGGGPAQDRSEQLHLSNPGGTDAVVDVTLFSGVASLEPSELQGLELPAGSSRVLDLGEHLDARSRWTAFARASSGEIVVGRVGRATAEEAPLRLVAVPGVSSMTWAPRDSGLAFEAQDGLVRRLRTGTRVGDDPRAEPGGPEPTVEPDPEEDRDPNEASGDSRGRSAAG